jgi:hypothetical protein
MRSLVSNSRLLALKDKELYDLERREIICSTSPCAEKEEKMRMRMGRTYTNAQSIPVSEVVC